MEKLIEKDMSRENDKLKYRAIKEIKYSENNDLSEMKIIFTNGVSLNLSTMYNQSNIDIEIEDIEGNKDDINVNLKEIHDIIDKLQNTIKRCNTMKIRNKQYKDEYNKLQESCEKLLNNIINIDIFKLSNSDKEYISNIILNSNKTYIISRMIDAGISYFEALNILQHMNNK